MNRSKSGKSVNTRSRLSCKQAGNIRQGASRKTTAREFRGQSSEVKPAKQASQPASKPTTILDQGKTGTGKASSATPWIVANPQLRELERGRQLRQLHEHGRSLAELARKFGCSKSLARDLVELAHLPEDLEELYLQGELGRKKALKTARAGKKQANSRTSDVSTMLQNDTHHNSTRVLNEKDRDKSVGLIIEWVRSPDLEPCDWEGFFQQVKFGLHGPFRRLFSAEAPKPHKINPDEDPREVIKRCKAEGGNPNSVPGIINNAVVWFARWVQWIIPDRAMMEDAIDKARGQLLREARRVHSF